MDPPFRIQCCCFSTQITGNKLEKNNCIILTCIEHTYTLPKCMGLDHRLEQGVVLLERLEVGGGLDPAGLLGSCPLFFSIAVIRGLQNIGVPISCVWDPHYFLMRIRVLPLGGE
jgi:hypothetical protein